MKTGKSIFILSLLVLLIGCSDASSYDPNKPTEFFRIEGKPGDGGIFVLSNAPNDEEQLRKVIEKYNFETISPDSIKNNRFYMRVFYRETTFLTRNFKAGRPYKEVTEEYFDFPLQDLSYHAKDELMYIIYGNYDERGIEYSYWINTKRNKKYGKFTDGEVPLLIHNIDSFYTAKRKEYNLPDTIRIE